MLDRRQILLGVSALMGGSLLPSSAIALKSSFSISSDETDKILLQKQLATISTIADIIIPETDTPSATGADVPEFIDRALANWFTRDETESFLAGLTNFLSLNSDFPTTRPETQYVIVKKLDDQIDNLPRGLKFYRQLKELTLIGYYTSEVGATLELAYDPIPGGYVPFQKTDETKAWST